MESPEFSQPPLSRLRVAIVHYWFVGRAGGERVVEAIAEMYPQADVFALVADRATLAPVLQSRKLQTSFLDRIPGAKKFYRHLLFLQPLALEQFDLSGYDLVISSESGPAKGVITSPKTCHICYCHSPMRYIWDMYSVYRQSMNSIVGAFFGISAHYMRLWDYASAGRVDYFLANSHFIASRIRKIYGRESIVVHPPVDTFAGHTRAPAEDYYLIAGRLVDYKRVDLAIAACNQLGRKLRIIGEGPQTPSLRKIAGPTVQFLGRLSDDELHAQMAACRALLFPGEEDFGIVPVEAQSFGRPVIAYGSGGALETVRGDLPGAAPVLNPTGIFFHRQDPASMADAILEFERREQEFSPEAIRNHAQQFDVSRFKSRMQDVIVKALHDFKCRGTAASEFLVSERQPVPPSHPGPEAIRPEGQR